MKKLYNTKRNLSISPTFKIVDSYRSWGERPFEDIAVIYKDGRISRFSQDPDSPFYITSWEFPYGGGYDGSDKKNIFGVARLYKGSRVSMQWDFYTHVYDHEGRPQHLGIEKTEKTVIDARKAGIQAVRDHYVRVNQILMQAPEERLEQELIKALKSHDWYHAMSDDHRYWAGGQASMKRIKHLMREMKDSDRAEELFEEFAPEGVDAKGIITRQRPIVVGDFFLKRDILGAYRFHYYEVLKVNRRSLVLREKNFRKSKFNPKEYVGEAFRVPYPQKKWNVIKHEGITYTLKGTED